MTLTRRAFARSVAILAVPPPVFAAGGDALWVDHLGFALLPIETEAGFAAWRRAWARGPDARDRWLDAFAAAYGGAPSVFDAAAGEAALMAMERDADDDGAALNDFLDRIYEEAFREEEVLRMAMPAGPLVIGRADPDYIR